jgi:hypothetical protein
MNVMTLAKTVITEKKYPSAEPNIAVAPRTMRDFSGQYRVALM